MNEYNEDMLDKLELCKGCLKMYYFDNQLKTCGNCRERSIRNNEKPKDIILCSKNGCKFKRSTENIYCGKHQICLFEDEVKIENKKVCINFIRGCHAKLETDYNFSRCEECLEKNREKDKNCRAVVIEKNTVIESQSLESRFCTSCCKELSIDHFIGELHDIITKTCKACRECNKRQDAKRDREHRNEVVRSNMRPQYTTYKKGARERNLDFLISYEEYETIVKNPCYYCRILQERGFNGIDRMNSSSGYILSNCVSCCQMCNYMKGTLSINVFIKRVEHILTHQGTISGKLYPDCFANHIKCTFKQYRNRAARMGIEFSISESQYNSITNDNCYICGKMNDTDNENGIDRIDNKKGYTVDNVKSCCAECNCMKIDYDLQDILEKFMKINRIHCKNNIIYDDNSNGRNYRF
jgi:hypothetical protein